MWTGMVAEQHTADMAEADILAEMLDAARLAAGTSLAAMTYGDTGRVFPLNIHALLERNGAEFVTHAYTELLGRVPGEDSLAHYHAALAEARLSKIEILGEIRYSPEGDAMGKTVPGLRQRYLMQRSYRLPLLGRLLRIGSAILLLPRALREMQRLEQAAHADRLRLEAVEKSAAATGPGLVVRVAQLEGQLADMARLERRLAELEQRAGEG